MPAGLANRGCVSWPADAPGFGTPVLICIKQSDPGRGCFSPSSLGFAVSLRPPLLPQRPRRAALRPPGLAVPASGPPAPVNSCTGLRIPASLTRSGGAWSPEAVALTVLQGASRAEGWSEGKSAVDGASSRHLSQPLKVE